MRLLALPGALRDAPKNMNARRAATHALSGVQAHAVQPDKSARHRQPELHGVQIR
jgi:hypothetical protein